MTTTRGVWAARASRRLPVWRAGAAAVRMVGIAMVTGLLAAATPAAAAAPYRLELATSTRFPATLSAARLGMQPQPALTLSASFQVAEGWRVEATWRAAEVALSPEFSKATWDMSANDLMLGAVHTVLDGDWWTIDGRFAGGSRWRQIDTYEARGASWSGWALQVEGGLGSTLQLARKTTRDRYGLGLRLEFGWQHTVGRALRLKPGSVPVAGAEVEAIDLGTLTESGAVLRLGVFFAF